MNLLSVLVGVCFDGSWLAIKVVVARRKIAKAMKGLRIEFFILSPPTVLLSLPRGEATPQANVD
jgi:hypothetical protein